MIEFLPVNPQRIGMITIDCVGIIVIDGDMNNLASAGVIFEIELKFSMPSSSHLKSKSSSLLNNLKSKSSSSLNNLLNSL